jgi:hypothetical protein
MTAHTSCSICTRGPSQRIDMDCSSYLPRDREIGLSLAEHNTRISQTRELNRQLQRPIHAAMEQIRKIDRISRYGFGRVVLPLADFGIR